MIPRLLFRGLLTLLTRLAALGLFAFPLASPAQAPNLRPAATPVPMIEFRVLERGKTVAGLGSGDFELTTDGVRYPVSAVRYGPGDLDTVLLVDASCGFSNYPRQIASVIQSRLYEIGPGERLGVMLLSGHSPGRFEPRPFDYDLVLPLTADRRAIELVLYKIVPSPSTYKSVSGAILRAAQYMQREGRASARKHIVFVGDTLNPPEVPLQKLMPPVREADATVDAVLRPVPPEWLAVRVDRTRTKADIFTFDVRSVVHATDGLEMVTAGIAAAVAEMLRDLRERYSISYEVGNNPAPKSIEVKLSAEARKLHAKAVIEARGFRRSRVAAAGEAHR
jgi:hypothetical protein